MIFIGYNSEISFPRYYDHHSKWTDCRCLPLFINRRWNNLKRKYPAYQVIEWMITYRKPYCPRCMEIFIEKEWRGTYNGIKNPTRQDRINIAERLKKRFDT